MKQSEVTTAAPKFDESLPKDEVSPVIAKVFPKMGEVPSAATGELFLKVFPTVATMFDGKPHEASPPPSSPESKVN